MEELYGLDDLQDQIDEFVEDNVGFEQDLMPNGDIKKIIIDIKNKEITYE